MVQDRRNRLAKDLADMRVSWFREVAMNKGSDA
jgi:hypothetical protein